MDTYAKTWIELSFPVYVIVLVVIVILICKYSTKFSSLIGKKNPVFTLATLILLSYAKLLQNIITAISYAVLNYPDGSHEVAWCPDASVRYIRGKHILLFLTASVILVLGIAYTVILFSWQWLLQYHRGTHSSGFRTQSLPHLWMPTMLHTQQEDVTGLDCCCLHVLFYT